MNPRKMSLVAYLKAGPTSHHLGMWRHPETEIRNVLDPGRYEHIARVLEDGKFDAFFFADVLGMYDYYGGSLEALLGRGGQMNLLDPMMLLPMMSRVTSHIGLGATLSTTLINPYHIARMLGSLDILSKGRVAWNVVASASTLEAQNFGFKDILGRDERYDRADEVMEACFALWDGWDGDILTFDKERGIFADHSRVRYANYQGRWIKTRGPLTIPRSPQGRPVIMQAGASNRGRDFAARWAEMIFVVQPEEAMKDFYRDVKERMVRLGRAPNECAILTTVDVVLSETEAAAKEKAEYLNDLVDPQSGLAQISSHIGIDLSQEPIDKPLDVNHLEEGSRGVYNSILKYTKSHGASLKDVAKRYGISGLAPQLVGTPEIIADKLEYLFASDFCDGFILSPTTFPGMFEEFCQTVVPELQRRGLFRAQYVGQTLRENLRDSLGE